MTAEQHTPTLESVLLGAIKAQLKTVRIGMPGIVQSYDVVTQTASVQPALTEHDGTKVPPITNVPVLFPGSASHTITWPLSPGDEVWLFFAERSIDAWLDLGGYRPPDNPRLFDWSDAVCYPAPLTKGNPITQASTENMVIASRSGSETVELRQGKVYVDATTIQLGSGATDFVALAAKVLTELQHIATQYNSHTHSGAVGIPALFPITPATDVTATKVKAE